MIKRLFTPLFLLSLIPIVSCKPKATPPAPATTPAEATPAVPPVAAATAVPGTLAEIRANAEKGDAKAQNSLGLRYDEGNGVTQDAGEAATWYRKAAEQGYADAQFNLGLCYASGAGVTKNAAESVNWYLKAAEQNFAAAQLNLGVCYDDGEGVVKDVVEALKWYNLAASQGSEDAATYRTNLEKGMTQEQIASAKKMSDEFKSKSAH
ncbi:MAG: tetratricopeptide repeat protein [Prosthecobacter sp.]